jgi:hypothetical protein
MSLRSQKAAAQHDRHLTGDAESSTDILQGRAIQPRDIEMTAPLPCDAHRETIPSEHVSPSEIRPVSRRRYCLSSCGHPGPRHTKPIQRRASIFNSMTSEQCAKNANEPMQLIPVPSGLSAYLLLFPLRGQEECRKQAGIPDRGR